MRTRKLLPGGLRWRLTAWVAIVMGLCAGVIFIAVYRGTETQLRHQIDHELAGDVGEFTHALQQLRNSSPAALTRAASRYVNGQAFGASSTLLFAVIPGAGTSTNQPELFEQLPPDRKETSAEQARENRLTAQLRVIRVGYRTLPLPDVGELRLLERSVQIGHTQAIIGVGEPLGGVDRAKDGVARAFILAGVLALAGALLASYLVGARVSRPLRKMAAIAARVDGGDLEPRIETSGTSGDEVRVLADAFNHMLDRLSTAFAGQRAFIADASHELRTPLTVIGGQLEVLAAQEHPSSQEVRRVEHLVRSEISRMSRLVDDLLLLAKSEQRTFLQMEPIDLQPYIDELWSGVSATAERRFELGPIPKGTLHADPDRLAQALRNLTANAIEHTASGIGLVALHARQTAGNRLCFSVEDDGPGIPADQRERVFDRFHRTDSARNRALGGSGLGLAIVRAIAEAHGGGVRALTRPGGGTRIELEFPRFHAPDSEAHKQPRVSATPASTRVER